VRWIAGLALVAAAGTAHAQGIGIGIVGKSGIVSVPSKTIVLRAPECAPLYKGGDGATTNIWESAKLPALKQHCEKLQLAVNALGSGHETTAIDYANKAELDTPGQAGPWVVKGQALARREKLEDALAAFQKAKTIHARALDDPEALDDYGLVLVRLGKLDDARKAFRSLLPRISGTQGLCGLSSECDAAGRAYLTAGALALEAGTQSLDEAVAMLREARAKSDSTGVLRRVCALALALALDRRGDADQAREIVADVVSTKGIPSEISSEILVRLPFPEEATAMRALGLEGTQPAASIEAWKAYLTGGGEKRTWATHAKDHLKKLEKPGAKPPAAKPK
jgi:hypothetical protein